MGSKKYMGYTAACAFAVVLFSSQEAYAMHIMEGFLPPMWAAVWFAASLPFIWMGIRSIKKISNENVNMKMLLGICGAFAFVLSSLKLPSVTGSCSHPTGVGLSAILFGPAATSIMALIVLLFQALLLAHGGLTTLGANVFSMGIAGPITSFFLFKTLNKAGASKSVSVFTAAALGNLVTYVVTSIQLGLAFPGEIGTAAAIGKFMGIFALTQVPLAVSEGLLTVVIYNLLASHHENELNALTMVKEGR